MQKVAPKRYTCVSYAGLQVRGVVSSVRAIMKFHCGWRALHFLAVLALGMGLVNSAGAQMQSLTIMAPAAPGGGWDQTSRAMQQVMRRARLVRSVQVLNVPGAGGTIGLARLVNTNQGDGNLLMTTGLIMVGAVLTNKSPVTLQQATLIARLTGEYEVLVVPAASPHRTLAGFIQAWKANPGQFAIAGGSAGGTDHMLAGLLAKEVGIDVNKVNYIPHSGGGESIASLLGNHVAAGINGYAELNSFIQTGKMRALAISSEQRLPGLDIPTFVEQGIDLSLANWRGVAAAPGISSRQRAALIALIDRMRRSDEWKAVLKRNSWIDMYLPGPEFDAFLTQENIRVTGVLKSIGLIE